MFKFAFTCILSFHLFFIPFLLTAVEKPTPEEIRSVIDYYYSNKKLGPILLDLKLCEDYHRSGSLKFECTQETQSNKIQYGKDIYLWLNFFWNQGKSYDIIVNYVKKNLVRRTYDLELPEKGSIRYRIPLIFHANKKGEWTMNVYYDNGKTPQLLRSVTIVVQ